MAKPWYTSTLKTLTGHLCIIWIIAKPWHSDSVVLSLLDHYLPFVRRCTFTCDKPWVTPEFRQPIKRRQRAFLSGQLPLYRKLRNQIKRMAASLRKKYFQNKIESLHSLDPHTWWTKIKNLLQFPDSNHLQSLRDSQSDAGLPITELINNFFVGISAGLPELDSSSCRYRRIS